MWRYIIYKFLTSIVAILLTLVIFYLLYVGIKGNPFKGETYADIQVYEEKLRTFEINLPIWERFIKWFSGIFKDNWGFVYKLAPGYIPSMFFRPLRESMLVAIPSYFLGMFFGLLLGFWAGYKRGKITDVLINGFVTVFVAVPSFVIVSFGLLIAPLVGLPPLFESSAGLSYMIRSLIIPIVTMTLISLAAWAYLARIEVSNVLTSDYILAARTRGFSEWFIFRRYVFRNSIYPFISAMVTSFMIVFSSSLVVERFFNFNGTASLILTATANGEINILMFNLLFFTSVGVFTQLLSDIAIFTINPLIRASFVSRTSIFTKIRYQRIRKNAKNISVVAEGGAKDE